LVLLLEPLLVEGEQLFELPLLRLQSLHFLSPL
jgi:hypothetical protein